MEWIKNLKVANKLYLLIAIASIVLIFASGVGFYFTKTAAGNTASLYNDRVLPIAWFSDIREDFALINAKLESVIINRTGQDNCKNCKNPDGC